MTDLEVARVERLRKKGLGYSRISKETGININTVKAHCRRHPIEVKKTEDMPPGICLQCGATFPIRRAIRPRKYCSDECRQTYWKIHDSEINRKAYYDYTCQHCGKTFTGYGQRNRKYCSNKCFIDERFGEVDESQFTE